MGSYDEATPNKPHENASSLAARRARLRGSLAKQALPPDPYLAVSAQDDAQPDADLVDEPNDGADAPNKDSENIPLAAESQADVQLNLAGETGEAAVSVGGKERRAHRSAKEPVRVLSDEVKNDELFQAPTVVSSTDSADPAAQVQSIQLQEPITVAANNAPQQVLELLNNMDQTMGVCAMNLAALQKAAGEQTEALRTLTQTLQHQTFSELGLNLTSLMESMSAALEPMKAVGELVPAIDQLVSSMEAKVSSEGPATNVGPDVLLMSLADQLGADTIDARTFKSAYMAVYPGDHPADLLHRLVELLGTQRLSGDLFRKAYDAVQMPEPAPYTVTSSGTGDARQVEPDPALMAELEELKRSQPNFEEKMRQREDEFKNMLSVKEQELQEAQELLNSRWEEFNSRYDELTESLQKRDEMLQEKDAEITRKESENVQLRAQMEELREMMTDLQKQFSSGRPSEDSTDKSGGGFFDVAPGQNQPPTLFDAAPAKPLFAAPAEPANEPAQESGASQTAQSAGQGSPSLPTSGTPVPAPAPAQAAAPPGGQAAQMQMPSSQAVPRQSPAATPFTGAGPGSYGSGVRAQVFEVIVRQALAGAPWREICAGPMQVNNISPDEVEAEVKRRQALLKK